jgi:hypothetical protein
MDHQAEDRIDELLREILHQGYPLEITQEAAMAMQTCIDRIMEMVPEDDRILVRREYSLATSALTHPVMPDADQPERP